jgi:OOP family OmpA-OmpF porin
MSKVIKVALMKKLFTTAFIMAGITTHAQFGYDYLKAADRYFKAADYASAAVYYEKYLQPGTKQKGSEYDPYDVMHAKKTTVNSNADQALYHLAESYRLLTNYEKAEPVYKQLLNSPRDVSPLAYYHYATVLRAQAKYDEAEQAVNKFLDKYTASDEYSTTAQRELQNLRFIQQQLARKDLDQYTVQKITPAVQGSSYAPAWTSGNRLLFTATWPDSARSKKQGYINHVYQAAFTGSVLNGITQAGLPDAPMHEGTPALSIDGNTLYLTRWNIKEGKKSAAIYKSTKTGDSWSAPELLNTIVNEPNANAQQPVLMANGKYLLYSSDKKGGQGGYDLWIAELNSEGQPVTTTNLGNIINTAFNEEAPWYHAASQSLVFASNGRVGMGGYDLFYSKGEPGNWSGPVNFGYPVNSVKDDIYFAAHIDAKQLLENVLISSDRTAICCLELFHITFKEKQETIVKDTVRVPTMPPPPKELFAESKLEIRNILFAFNDAAIPATDHAFLDRVVDYLQKHPEATIEIGAHTDGKGPVEYNLKLSARRAQSCYNYLVKAGIAPERLKAKGYGECCPIENERTPDGKDDPAAREKNRRIEIKLL